MSWKLINLSLTYKTRKSNRNQLSHFGLIEEIQKSHFLIKKPPDIYDKKGKDHVVKQVYKKLDVCEHKMSREWEKCT